MRVGRIRGGQLRKFKFSEIKVDNWTILSLSLVSVSKTIFHFGTIVLRHNEV